MTFLVVALLILGIWWLVTPHGKEADEGAPRRRRGPERAWSRSAEWLRKLEADREARKQRAADAATKKEIRDLERMEKEGGEMPDEVASALERSTGGGKRDGGNGGKKQGKKDDT